MEIIGHWAVVVSTATALWLMIKLIGVGGRNGNDSAIGDCSDLPDRGLDDVLQEGEGAE